MRIRMICEIIIYVPRDRIYIGQGFYEIFFSYLNAVCVSDPYLAGVWYATRKAKLFSQGKRFNYIVSEILSLNKTGA
jgi:hypothetical protein